MFIGIKGKFTQDLVSGTHDIVTGTQKMESDTQKNLLKFLYVSGYIYTKKSYLHTKKSNLHTRKSYLHTRIKLFFPNNNNRCPVSIILM